MRTIVIILLGFSLLMGGMVYGLLIYGDNPQGQTETNTTAPAASEVQPEAEEVPTVEPLPKVQSQLDSWLKNKKGEYSIVVTDLATGTELASHRTEESYFAASIYKLYVAYLGYVDVQTAEYGLDEPFIDGFSRGECLDKMIGESHSPCAEKMWVEQGKEASTVRLEALGLKGTSMTNITTTAHDVNVILERLDAHRELSKEYTQRFLSSLKKNIYRDVLPKALPDLTVYDKVGFEGYVEYHDVGIVELENGRRVAITMLSRNAGTSRLRDLTQTIFEPLITAAKNT